MWCVTRKDMKFGDYFIPSGTKCTVINKLDTTTVDAPGVHLKLSISLWDMRNGKPCVVTEVNIPDEFSGSRYSPTLVGVVINASTQDVFMDAGDRLYDDKQLYGWQVQKVVGEEIPESITKAKYSNNYTLSSVIDFLEDEFSEWVQTNCHFRKLTKRDIENGNCFDGAEVGGKILSDKGLQQFEDKKREYQKRLETIGFTYDFHGGLIWD
jgi:hypothetical protein